MDSHEARSNGIQLRKGGVFTPPFYLFPDYLNSLLLFGYDDDVWDIRNHHNTRLQV